MSEVADAGAPVVAAARSWIGTPYLHGASLKGGGADCLGLVRGVWRAIHGREPERPPAYAPDWSEPSGEEALWRAMARHMREAAPDAAESGDILLFRLRRGGPAKHLGILAADPAGAATVIHAYSGHGVVESALCDAWRRRLVAAFRMPTGEF